MFYLSQLNMRELSQYTNQQSRASTVPASLQLRAVAHPTICADTCLLSPLPLRLLLPFKKSNQNWVGSTGSGTEVVLCF